MSPDNERLDILIAGRCKIWQAKDVFCYTLDSILLGSFLWLRKQARVLELGSGTGAISLLAAARGAKQVVGIEINPRAVELFERSIRENNWQDRIQAVNKDLRQWQQLLPLGRFDSVVANPPYRKANSGRQRSGEHAGAACHELAANLEDFILAGSRLLKTRGRLALVNLTERLPETLELLTKYHFQPKRLQFVHSKQNSPAKVFLLEATYGALSGGLAVLEPIVVYEDTGEYTPMIRKLYQAEEEGR